MPPITTLDVKIVEEDTFVNTLAFDELCSSSCPANNTCACMDKDKDEAWHLVNDVVKAVAEKRTGMTWV
jgi:hypothetical protein